MKGRRYRMGDRVWAVFKRDGSRWGRIATPPVKDSICGLSCRVNWDDGSTSLVCTADLRRQPPAKFMVPLS